jgi:hypothetical protein
MSKSERMFKCASFTLSGAMAMMVLVTSPGQAASNPLVITQICHVSSLDVECFAMVKAWPGFVLPPVGEEGAEREEHAVRACLREVKIS